MRTVTISEAKVRLSQIVDEVYKTHDSITIFKDGEPETVLISIQEYESLVETLEVLSDPELMEAIRISEREIEAEKFTGN
jgi:prevent-host-death family protein